MSQTQDTVDLLQADIERWMEFAREIGRWHGHDAFTTALRAMDHMSGTVGPLEIPVPSARRVRPRPFLVEWAELIAKSRWRIPLDWFKTHELPSTLVPFASRLIQAQREGHDAGVDGAAAFARLPKMMRLIASVGIGSVALYGLLGRRAA